MEFKQHLTSDEEVLSYCTTDFWAWVCTNKRIIKYRQGNNNSERLHDISINEVTGISLVDTGRSQKLLGYGMLSAIGGIISLFFGFIISEIAITSAITIALWILGIIFYNRWKNSGKAHFDLRGSGLIQQEPDKWKINKSSDNNEDIQEFVRTIREQIQ